MKIVSVINYKGGVGKTTIVANLAAELAWRGKRVLLIDLDPQASLTFSFVSLDLWRQRYANSRTIKTWYDAYLDGDSELSLASLIITPSRIQARLRSRNLTGVVDLISSHLGLINIDLELASRLAGGTMRQVRLNFLRLHSRLRTGLDALPEDEYDVVLIDCPPNFNVVTKTALVASDLVLIPTIPDYLSTLGIDQLTRHLDQLVQDFNENAADVGGDWAPAAPAICGIVLTMVRVYGGDLISTQRQYAAQLRRDGYTLFDATLRRNDTRYGDAPQYGVPLVLLGAQGATYTAVLTELENLTTEFATRAGI